MSNSSRMGLIEGEVPVKVPNIYSESPLTLMDGTSNLIYDRTSAFTSTIVSIVRPEPQGTRAARIQDVIQDVNVLFPIAE